jgi:hypothetical protein
VAFTAERVGTRIVSTRHFTLLADTTGRWPMAVQRIRIAPGEIDDAVEAARSLMCATGTGAASWWLSEHSTPPTIEVELIGRGLRIVDGDYLIDGMALTTPPPPGPPDVEARPIADVGEFVEAVRLQYDAFKTPSDRRRDEEEIVAEYEQTRLGRTGVLFGAWLDDGGLVGAGWGLFSPRGVLLAGGATRAEARGRGAYRTLVRARWDEAVARRTPALAVQAGTMSAPILRRAGFVKVCQFRRLHDVLSSS